MVSNVRSLAHMIRNMTKPIDQERPQFAEERRAQIADYVARHGRAHVAELVARFGVTEPTIRRDLAALDGLGVLRRTHGGAVSRQPPLEPALDSRDSTHVAEKEAIAAACMNEIEEGSSVYLDSGSTIVRVAHRLRGHRVNVLTNSIGVAEAIAEVAGVRHTVLGGQLRPVAGCFVGPLAIECLAKFMVNVAVIGASGVSAEGISEADLAEAQLKAAVIERARRVVVAVDSSKIGRRDFALVCSLDRVSKIVTDSASPRLEEICARHGVEVVVAETVSDDRTRTS